MATEPVPSNGLVYDVPAEEMKRVYAKPELRPEQMSLRAAG